MSVIHPFKGYRPAPEFASAVAALPYDVMTSEEARVMVKGNPYSFLHVDRAEIDLPEDTDHYCDEVYAKAASNLQSMIDKGILIHDDKNVLYIYRLTMNGRSQTGLVCCTSIDEYIENKIKKHELTRESKERDRIRHVDACNANTGPIFLTYRDNDEVNRAIADFTKNNAPVYDFVSEDGIGHTVWVIDDEKVTEGLVKSFADVEALYIADGHHRNASAVKVGLMRRKAEGDYNKNSEYNFYLSVLFPKSQLHIMDYNRVVTDLNGLSEAEFISKIKESFDVDEYNGEGCLKPEKLHTFGMYLDKKWYLLKAKQVDESDPVKSLDVSILQDKLLAPILGIGDPRTDDRIDFVGGIRGLGELVKRVDEGNMKVAFSMYPTTMEQLMNIADKGKIMPPKSTWFEPKLRSGIFIHTLE